MIYLIIAAIIYTAATMFSTYASRHADTTLAGGLTNAVGALMPLTLVALEWAKRPVHNEKAGILAAIGGGIAIGLFVIIFNKSLTVNKVAIVVPIIFGGSILLSTIAGYVIFKERATPYQLAGLVLLLGGLAFMSYARATGK